MNRKQFLKLMGLGAVAAAIVPEILAEKPQEDFCKKITEMKPNNTPLDQIAETFSIDDIREGFKNYKETGRRIMFVGPDTYDWFVKLRVFEGEIIIQKLL